MIYKFIPNVGGTMQIIDDLFSLSEFKQEELFPLTESEKNDLEHQKMRKEISTLRKSQFVRLGELLEQYKSARDEIDDFKDQLRESREEVRQLRLLVDRQIKDTCIHESTIIPVSKKMLKFTSACEVF